MAANLEPGTLNLNGLSSVFCLLTSDFRLLVSDLRLLTYGLRSVNDKCEISWSFYTSSSIFTNGVCSHSKAKTIFEDSIINDYFQMTNVK